MYTTTPPFRADMVGSLLRTAPLKDARAKREKNDARPPQHGSPSVAFRSRDGSP